MSISSNKRPKDINYFAFKQEEPVVEVVDSFQMLSMIFGVISFIFKYKFSAWLSLVFYLANYNEQKMNVPHGKFMMNFGLLILGFALIYIFPS